MYLSAVITLLLYRSNQALIVSIDLLVYAAAVLMPSSHVVANVQSEVTDVGWWISGGGH